MGNTRINEVEVMSEDLNSRVDNYNYNSEGAIINSSKVRVFNMTTNKIPTKLNRSASESNNKKINLQTSNIKVEECKDRPPIRQTIDQESYSYSRSSPMHFHDNKKYIDSKMSNYENQIESLKREITLMKTEKDKDEKRESIRVNVNDITKQLNLSKSIEPEGTVMNSADYDQLKTAANDYDKVLMKLKEIEEYNHQQVGENNKLNEQLAMIISNSN